ncbi:MAG: Asp23/Gls24 family envelope stress response protein [Chlamydiales bacterium]|nr:Asp23/Gls24 family envelope stress response protein [Chlamydiia bacterium]MCP5508297.1 Asp23/Gls24 family envelope stress response protein [Chlamydiales bacterium]
MSEQKVTVGKQSVDTKEFEYPETLFEHDIENRVFQGIVLQCLSKVKGITLVEGNFIDSLFGRRGVEGVKGIYAEQDSHSSSVSIRIEVNICFGEPIPDKAEEIQTKVAEEITRLTGLHVAAVHVVFKNVVAHDQAKRMMESLKEAAETPIITEEDVEEEYTDEF